MTVRELLAFCNVNNLMDAEIRVDDRTIESIRQDGYPLKDSGISYKDVLYPDRKKLLILEGRKGQSW